MQNGFLCERKSFFLWLIFIIKMFHCIYASRLSSLYTTNFRMNMNFARAHVYGIYARTYIKRIARVTVAPKGGKRERSLRSMRGGFIFRNRGPSLDHKVSKQIVLNCNCNTVLARCSSTDCVAVQRDDDNRQHHRYKAMFSAHGTYLQA